MQIIINNEIYTFFATKKKNKTEIQGISKDDKKIKINDLFKRRFKDEN